MVDYWAQSVAVGAVQNEFVDGIFTDDPAGYGQEHPSIRQRSTNACVASWFPLSHRSWSTCFGSESAVQLTPAEITALQVGTQRAWSKALRLLVRHTQPAA